jgi:RNA-directed DNA polymerase
MFGWLLRLFGSNKNAHRNRFDLDELARRIGLPLPEIQRVAIDYRDVQIPKRSGGVRKLSIPNAVLKTLQRRLLHRVFGKLQAHPAAYGFERGKSIADHARQHVGRAVVVKFDLRDFFTATTAPRVEAYFRTIGWNAEAAALLTKLCTWQGSLPQGAPTSPRLSNLVNYALDAKLDRVRRKGDGRYSRYADDLTFSYDAVKRSDLGWLIQSTREVCAQFGYRLNRRKTRIMRRHQRQQVTGLVVNDKIALPRETRRRLRAIEHQRRRRGECSLSDEQLAGWQAFRAMVEK